MFQGWWEQLICDFMHALTLSSPPPSPQLFLKLRTFYCISWLWDWWEKFVYLKGRDPIMINSNYYVLDSCWYQVSSQTFDH